MPKTPVTIQASRMDSADGSLLIAELNQVLTVITGDDGTAHFHPQDVMQENASFLIAYVAGIPCGCGALRQITADTGELKRIYARKNSLGVGSLLLGRLEEQARQFGYTRLLLETRIQNTNAIRFYQKNGYAPCASYGAYIGNENSYCMGKQLYATAP